MDASKVIDLLKALSGASVPFFAALIALQQVRESQLRIRKLKLELQATAATSVRQTSERNPRKIRFYSGLALLIGWTTLHLGYLAYSNRPLDTGVAVRIAIDAASLIAAAALFIADTLLGSLWLQLELQLRVTAALHKLPDPLAAAINEAFPRRTVEESGLTPPISGVASPSRSGAELVVPADGPTAARR